MAGQGHGQAQVQAHLAGRGRKGEGERGGVTNSPAKGNGRPLSIFMMSDRVDSLTWPQMEAEAETETGTRSQGKGRGVGCREDRGHFLSRHPFSSLLLFAPNMRSVPACPALAWPSSKMICCVIYGHATSQFFFFSLFSYFFFVFRFFSLSSPVEFVIMAVDEIYELHIRFAAFCLLGCSFRL